MLCRPRAITRTRRTASEMQAIREAILRTAKEYQPLTCRQLFYLLVTRGVVEKTERDYKSTVIRLLTDMRRDRTLPFEWIIDNTRWVRKPDTYRSMGDALENMRRYYRRDLWANQGMYVEIWAESDSVAGIIVDVTDEFDVPLMVCRGYASTTFLYSAARNIEAIGKPAYLYQVGDHDPSGVDIARHTEKYIREWSMDIEVHFERIAVLPDQIEAWNLPGRPTKTTDTRSRNFHGDSVEVEAIEPQALRQLVRAAVEQHIDPIVLQRTRDIEEIESWTLANVIAQLPEQGAL